MSRLTDQVAIVTGGAWGIGRATATRLAEEGAKVLIADVDMDKAQSNVAEIGAAGGVADAIRADVAVGADIRAMIDKAGSQWGRLDILVNNAYNPVSGTTGSPVDMSEEDWDYGIAVLIKSVFMAAKYGVPEMQKQGGGSIINMASTHGLLMAPGFLLYETGKSAIIGMTKQLATEFGPQGIRVNALCPGHIVTERVQEIWDRLPKGLGFFQDQYPLRRVGEPKEVADAIVYLCSAEASFITGAILPVDGGLSVQLQENFGVRQAHFLREHPETELPY